MKFPSSFRWVVPIHHLNLSEVVRVLRAMQEENQRLVVGITGDHLGLRATEEEYAGFLAEWQVLGA